MRFCSGTLPRRVSEDSQTVGSSVICLQEKWEVAGQDLCSTWTMSGTLPD